MTGSNKELIERKLLPGEIAFTLYDTYGFPLDLTQDALRSRGVTVDIEGFDAASLSSLHLPQAQPKASIFVNGLPRSGTTLTVDSDT